MSKDLKSEISVLIKTFENGRFKDVIDKSLILLKKNENDFLWNLLGLSFQKLNKIYKSIDCFENAINLNSKNFSAFNNIGLSYKKIKKYSQAKEYLLKSIELNPDYINALVNMGNIKNDTYFFDEALSYYKKALSLNKKLPLIYLNISNVYQTINDIENAKKYLNEAISIDKTFTMADQKLSKFENYTNDNSHLKNMKEKLKLNNLNDNQKVYLYFALYKAYKDLKNYDQSFYYLNLGNKLQRKLLNFDIDFYKSFSKKIKSKFSKLNFEDYKKNRNGKNYIFIIGMPRSGTTLIEKIVTSHSTVSTISESNFIPEKMIKNINSDFEEIKNFLDTNFDNEYKEFIKNFNIKNKIIVDKTLTNFWYLGFIKLFFPNSKIIHVSRNPKDNCLSIYENLFDVPEGWNSNEEELAEYFLIYQDMMKYWNKTFKEAILNVEYEDLVMNSESKIKEIIRYCDLSWENECLNFYKNNNPIKTISVNQANKPIYNSSINKFKIYEKHLNTLFSKLN